MNFYPVPIDDMIESYSKYNQRPLSPSNSKIEITNAKIVNFYKTHPNIDIDEINLYFINIISKFSPADNDLTTSLVLSSIKSEQFDKIENYFINTLSKIYPTADIVDNVIDNKDIVCIKRIQKSNILLKNIDIDSNVSNEQVDLFTNLIDKENCCGVILSQKSGISNKNHFQIDIRNKNIVIYIHNANYSQNMIMSAIDIIDNLYIKIQEFSKTYSENYNIPKEILDNINNEYQSFVIQKNKLIDTIKEYNKKILSTIDECKFTSLGMFLAEKYSASIQKFGFNCSLCNNYSANNLKALAAHKRGCIRKHKQIVL
jgi:hypothetical protein